MPAAVGETPSAHLTPDPGTPFGVGSRDYPVADSIVQDACADVARGHSDWVSLVGGFLDTTAFVEPRDCDAKLCGTKYGPGVCKCDFAKVDQESIASCKRWLWAVARLFRASADAGDVKPLAEPFIFTLTSTADAMQSKCLMLVFALFGPVHQIFIDLGSAPASDNANIQIPLRTSAFLDEAVVSVWMHRQGGSFLIRKSNYTFSSLTEVSCSCFCDITEQVRQLRVLTRKDDDLAFVGEVMKAASKAAGDGGGGGCATPFMIVSQ